MDLDLSVHAHEMLEERQIDEAWIAFAIQGPESIEQPGDGTVHYLVRIAARDNRVLRVVVNPSTTPPRLVTVFFDRRMKGRLS